MSDCTSVVEASDQEQMLTRDPRGQRKFAPVFVLGSPRSGTTLLYNMLLSAGGFAVYLAESNVFNVLALRFGDLAERRNRENLLHSWLNSKLFRATGLNRQEIADKILSECTNPGDFLRTVMNEIAREQGMQRWAENSPEAILHLPLIKRLIPEALVIQIIRDGRDVAVSLGNVRYLRPFPWEERQSLVAAGVYWEWIVQKGRIFGKMLGPDYMEVNFEDLITSPQETLNRIGKFIDHELDYERIRQIAYGSVSRPNTSFVADLQGDSFNPVGRWKTGISTEQLRKLEQIIGKTLLELGYVPTLEGSDQAMNLQAYATRSMYRTYFEAKLWFKQSSLLRASRRPLTGAEIDATMLAEDHPPEVRVAISEMRQ